MTDIHAKAYRERCFENVKNDLGLDLLGIEENDINKSVNLSYLYRTTQSKVRLENVYQIIKKKKQNQIQKGINEKYEKELSSCTFHPNISSLTKSNSTTNYKNHKDIISNLYEDSKQRQLLYKNEVEKKNLEEDEKLKKVMIKPEKTSLNMKIFTVNPLENDKNIKKEIERKERARIDKKISELQKEKGNSNLKNFTSIEELFNVPTRNLYKPMVFSIDKKTNKDTFSSYSKLNSYKKTYSDEKKIIQSQSFLDNDDEKKDSQVGNEDVLLRLDVNIDDNNRIEKLEIFKWEDVNQVINKFCHDYDISDIKKERLEKIVQERITLIETIN